jgi:hypothetical protein
MNSKKQFPIFPMFQIVYYQTWLFCVIYKNLCLNTFYSNFYFYPFIRVVPVCDS